VLPVSLLILFSDNEHVAYCLLHHGADINLINDRGMTPLHCACLHGNTVVAETLLEYGANINAPVALPKRPSKIAGTEYLFFPTTL